MTTIRAYQVILLLIVALVLSTSLSIVQGLTFGEAPGFAVGTTGGGDATPDHPKTLEELIELLGDDQPRVVVLDKEFSFLGSEGNTTETGCRPKSNTACLAKNNGFKGQDVILFPGDTTLTHTGGCDQQVKVEITYDNANKQMMSVGSNKTLRGVGKKGVLKGKGLKLEGDNIIIQNIHITELNPQYIWGGDAFFMGGIDKRALKKIWIDHVKVSRVGRQMFVSGFDGVESITISNSDFDGRTDWSSSCDGRHYWGFILDGTTTRVSFLQNYVHSTSGRSPKIIGASSPNANVVAHIANNYWSDNSGHSFEPGKNAFVLAEGNFFEGTLQPMEADAEKASISVADDCSAALGRSCPGNTVEKSGKFESVNGARALETVKKYKEITGYKPGEATQLSESADNFGVGTLGDSPSQGEVNQTDGSQSEANTKQEDPAPGTSTTGSQSVKMLINGSTGADAPNLNGQESAADGSSGKQGSNGETPSPANQGSNEGDSTQQTDGQGSVPQDSGPPETLPQKPKCTKISRRV
ncbi:hypothetical protein PPTG_17505 [Phytophthora nicotianae INRA-310]|uniref:pectin lyase n=1 Tax=Phytophthora nicotianae (strain INRA-310) TaxID=761204 RepID=W2PM06_PHYN3|nr:hypothetical protein PPTG_17505 [Phytophthora nicotianae INRA-310]ETN01065.1 hypothetical protein PPTG_17505 [Phytophthora nicotianae INRA-310]